MEWIISTIVGLAIIWVSICFVFGSACLVDGSSLNVLPKPIRFTFYLECILLALILFTLYVSIVKKLLF